MLGSFLWVSVGVDPRFRLLGLVGTGVLLFNLWRFLPLEWVLCEVFPGFEDCYPDGGDCGDDFNHLASFLC